MLALLSTGVWLAGCGDDAGFAADDPEAMGAEPASDDAKTDAYWSTSTYYFIRPDSRRCLFPLCGGMYYWRVNRTQTRCPDGNYADLCRAADVDWGQFSEEQLTRLSYDATFGPVVVRAKLREKDYEGHGNLGQLHVTEAYDLTAGDKNATGTFYRVTDQGNVTFHEAKLNSTLSGETVGIDLSPAQGATQSDAPSALDFQNGVLVRGTDQNGVLAATQIFVRLVPPATGK